MQVLVLDFKERRRRLGAKLREHKLDALVVCAAANIRYLSGFTGSNALLLVSEDRCVLFTDPRYEIQAASEADCEVKVARGPLAPELARAAMGQKLLKVGFEKTRISFETYELLRKHLDRRASFQPAPGLVEELRLVKSGPEIALIRRSVQTCSEAFAAALRKIKPDMTELDLAAELDYQMRRHGAEGSAFETIVAAGERSALPHARPSRTKLAGNQVLLIDMGATRDGYASDMTRTVFLERPAGKMRRLYRSVLEAQGSALAAVRAGITGGWVDREARRRLRASNLDRAFVHSVGHGLGLEIHEPPRLGKGEKSRLQAGMVVTIEPGVYLEGVGGIRIEDTVLVTKTGCEVLTRTPKELLVVA